MIEIRYLAKLRDELGKNRELIDYHQGMTLFDLKNRMLSDCTMSGTQVLHARNHEFCDENVSLSDGDIIAFFPPVTGG